MSCHRSNGAVLFESGSWENHSYKHKEKYREHKNPRDHNKKGEQKEQEMSAKHNDLSVKKHRDKDKIKHRHRSKDMHTHREKRDDKEKLFGKEVKYEPANDTPHHLTMPEHKHTLKRGGNEDNSSDSKKIKAERDETTARKRKRDDHDKVLKPKAKKHNREDSDKEKLFGKEVNHEPANDTPHHLTLPEHKHALKRGGNEDNSSDSKKMKAERDETTARKRKREVLKPKKAKKLNGEDSDKEPEDMTKHKIARKREQDGKVAKPKKARKKNREDSDGMKKAVEETEEYKWWNEERYTDGTMWRFLEHKGPVFDPEYEPLPNNVKFYYNGEHVKLSLGAEEVATFFAKMLDHEYVTKVIFRENFFKDWRKEMTEEERAKIKDLKKCDFREISDYFKAQSEARRAMSREGKQKIKNENERLLQEYGFCIMDKRKERIANFRTEPPGLFRGRGDHPKMGMLKRKINAGDCIINCSEDSEWPKPPPGKKWKEVRHDNKVTWLVSWTDNIKGNIKYITLNPSSRVKAEKDVEKFETARNLKKCVDRIRAQYRDDWKSNEMRVRQRAVALYFIDKLALRAGNEKEEGETADTVGCCSLRVEHITLHQEKDGALYVVEFDFPGKDSIRYYNAVPVEKRVFKNLHRFMENKQPKDDMFDRVTTDILNRHLQEQMDGLTAKVFRTYNASITLQQQLKELTEPQDNVAAKVLSYNRANRAVAVLCNHQRAPPKNFEASMQNLQAKIDAKRKQLSVAKREAKKAKADAKEQKNKKSRLTTESKKKVVQRIEEQLMRLELQATDREENKQIALGTSKLNYLDPRISVAWCKSFNVSIEKIYNKSQRDKFACFIDMAGEDFEF